MAAARAKIDREKMPRSEKAVRADLIDGGLKRAVAEPLAVRRRRESRRREFILQAELAMLLTEYLDPVDTFWTSLENKPLSRLSGYLQRKRGVRSGLPDLFVFQQKPGRLLIAFIEVKSPAGIATKSQKQICAALKTAGAAWWMARSTAAALHALHLSGIAFRRPWKPPRLEPWEGPFVDPTQRLPQAPDVAARRREEQRRRRARAREREATKLAAERDDAAGGDIAA